MPFTLAHPAAVLPLRYLKSLRTAPLFVGAVVPDLPYYVPSLGGHSTKLYTHSATGSYLVDLPLGLFTLGCLVLLREPLTALLPARARWLTLQALEPFRHSLVQWLLAVPAILIGVWTHLLWDSFTHGEGWVVRRVPELSRSLQIGWYRGDIYHILQYISSVVGLAILAVWYSRLRVPPGALAGEDARRAHAGPALFLIAGAALLVGGVEAVKFYARSDGAIYGTLDALLTHGIAWFVLLHLFAGSIVALEHRSGGVRAP
jgi:hypothetical protein